MIRNELNNIFILGFVASILIAINIRYVDAKMNPDQLRNMMKPMAKTCISKTGVDKDVLAATRDGIYAEDPKLMCYESCLLKMMKVLTKDNKINVESMIKQIEAMVEDDLVDRMKDLCRGCAEKATSTDPCEVGWQFIKCYDETDHALMFLP